jgi:hypothetical protein
MKTYLEKREVSHEKLEAKVEACLGATEACLGKTETMIRASQEREPKLRLAWKKKRPQGQRPIKEDKGCNRAL